MTTSVVRHRLLAAVAALAVAIALVLTVTPGADRAWAQEAATVDTVDFTFDPNSVTITAGGTVTWTNSDSVAHTATGDGGSFDTGNIAPGGSASITFDTPGTYSYFCAIHPDMTGTVVVQAAVDGGEDDAVTGLPDTGTGIDARGQTGGTAAAMLTGSALALALVALALRRRTA